MTYNFATNLDNFKNDFEESLRAFQPLVEINEKGTPFYVNVEIFDKYANIEIKIGDFEADIYKFTVNLEQFGDKYKKNSVIKQAIKLKIYDYLAEKTGCNLPYGALTGIRPTKLYHDIEAEGKDSYHCFVNDFRVSHKKADLVRRIVETQRPLREVAENEIDVFLNIPICVSRCSYCSFISSEYRYVKKLLPQYTQCLLNEIDSAKHYISNNNLSVRAVYIGGGTPTSLDDELFDKVVKACDFKAREYTVEAGRPDTLSQKKVESMLAANVSRVSVNPQTFNQKTLDLIGRKHSVAQIYEAFELCKSAGFDINADLIAMLPEESFNDFCYSLDCALKLAPENLTVHTLAIKAGSKLKENNYVGIGDAEKMVDYSAKQAEMAGYIPYYSYRQKYMSGSLENVGYAKAGKECLYNIDIMEETTPIIAIGAGGISKRIFRTENRIERFANPKGLEVFIERFDSNLLKKEEFFS